MSLDVCLSNDVYRNNITHNLGKMAGEAGIYEHLWRPEELVNVHTARDLIAPLEAGLELLRSDPDRFKKLNPENGWGDYDGLYKFVSDYLAACRMFPDSSITANR